MTEDMLLLGSQEAIAPGDGVTHRPLSSRSVARASLEDREALPKPIAQCRRREDADSRGRQFNGERQPIELAADVGYDMERVIRCRKPRIHRPRPFDEKLDGRVLREIPGLRSALGRERQRFNWLLLLTTDEQWCSARRQNLQLRAHAE